MRVVRILIIIAILLNGCGLYKNGYKPTALFEKKINQSRKAQIVKNGKTEIVAIATYLNSVDSSIYRAEREYFFVEIFSELDIPLMESLRFSLTNNVDFIWIREVKADEMSDEGVISTYNRWGRGFLIAFDELEYQQKKNMKLTLEVENVGTMIFDFSYKVLEMQL